MNNGILLQTVDLKKYFKVNGGRLHAVDGVNLSVKAGSTIGIVGESGCGKSTLGRTILRLIEPTSGTILFDQTDITKCSKREMKAIRTQMQIIFQDPFASLNPRMSVYELISEPLRMNHVFQSNREMSERIYQLMDTVGLARRLADTYPHEMDGGRRQRVGVARAIALNPKFIVCDEPVSALDVSIQAQILNLLMDLQDEFDLTYMFITHDLSVVKHISDQICVMYLGECVELCDSAELFKNPLHPYTRALLSAIPRPTLEDNRRFTVLRGEVPNPINPKPGCRFAGRCDYCTDACTQENVPLIQLADGHSVACRLYAEGKRSE